jgi:peptide/nickel transport system substrate-binding protein
MAKITRRAALAGAFGAAAAFNIARAQSPRRTLTIAAQANPVVLDPIMGESNVAYRVLYNIFDTLIDTDYLDNLKLKPGLATAWRRIDGKTLELSLRPGVKFHNGDILTADDVAFSLSRERLFGEVAQQANVAAGYWRNLDKVEKVDDMTVRVVMSVDDVLLEHRLANWSAQIVSARGFRAAGGWEAWGRRPVGTGPFKVVDFRQDELMALEAHEDYWMGPPAIAGLRFRVVPELAARTAGLAAGQFDMITELSPDQVSVVARNSDVEVVGNTINNHRLVMYDSMTNPVLRDARVRQALNLAIDRQLIVDTLFGGRTVVPRSLQWEFFGEMFLADFPAYRPDPARARELLRAANYRGEPIQYRVLPNYYTNELVTAQALAGMWQGVGLNVEIAVRENFTQILEQSPNRGIRNWSNTAVYPDPLSSLWRQHGTNAIQGRFNEWSDPEYDRLGLVLERSLDLNERRTAFRRMLTIWEIENPCGTVLHQNIILYGKRKDVAWRPYPHQYMDFRPRNMTRA